MHALLGLSFLGRMELFHGDRDDVAPIHVAAVPAGTALRTVPVPGMKGYSAHFVTDPTYPEAPIATKLLGEYVRGNILISRTDEDGTHRLLSLEQFMDLSVLLMDAADATHTALSIESADGTVHAYLGS
ncbi:hypothetical protein ACIP93_37400 [Streptomyces sp. NPDC088745]|uniref:hypothetical protein n=1 Tax=Streptomyces sp. NPDC088745 TaxID=3365884 RepID=UPI00380F9B61